MVCACSPSKFLLSRFFQTLLQQVSATCCFTASPEPGPGGAGSSASDEQDLQTQFTKIQPEPEFQTAYLVPLSPRSSQDTGLSTQQDGPRAEPLLQRLVPSPHSTMTPIYFLLPTVLLATPPLLIAFFPAHLPSIVTTGSLLCAVFWLSLVFLLLLFGVTQRLRFTMALFCLDLDLALAGAYLYHSDHQTHFELHPYFVLVPLLIFFICGRRLGSLVTGAVITQGFLLLMLRTVFFASGTEPVNVDCDRLNSTLLVTPTSILLSTPDCPAAGLQQPYQAFGELGYGLQMQRMVLNNCLVLVVGIIAFVYEGSRKGVEDGLHKALADHGRADEAKRSFVANLAHELRTPMHGIIAMSKEILGCMDLTPRIHEAGQIISGCADHLLALLDDILDFERIESDSLVLEYIPMMISKELDSVIRALSSAAAKKDVTVSRVYESPLQDERMHMGDPLRFRQILFNLISNAIKFTPASGNVTITILDRAMESDIVNISVVDTGIGISSENISKLFKRRFGGSGLGLVITKKLCEAMKGSISVSSELGQGSEFTVTLRMPIATAEQTRQLKLRDRPPIGAQLDGLAGRSILLAEDNEINQKVGMRILSAMGCKVDIAHNGRECVERFTEGSYDLILMDCQMPEMDGFETATQIRAIEKTRSTKSKRHPSVSTEGSTSPVSWMTETPEDRKAYTEIPIIALTASATKEALIHSRECGMNDFLTKPLNKESLAGVLLRWLPPGPHHLKW